MEKEEEEEPWEFGDDKKYAVVVGLVVYFVWKTKGRVNSLSHGGPCGRANEADHQQWGGE